MEEAAHVAVAVAAAVDVVVVMTSNVMNVVSLVILLVSVAYALVLVGWEVGIVVALVLDDEGVQATGVGVIVLVGEGLRHLAVAYHLAETAATADHLHIVVPVVIHHMQMECRMG